MAKSNHIKVAISGVSKDQVSDFLSSDPEFGHWLIRCASGKKRKRLNACVIVAILVNEFDAFKAAAHRFFGSNNVEVRMLT